MCLPACTIQLAERASRRSFLRKAAVCATAAVPALVVGSLAAPPASQPAETSFSHIVDLTHTLSASFPFPMKDAFALERISTRGKDMWNINRWHFHEHIGTHIDAPFHCSDGDTAERIPADKLIGPLVIVDIRDRAASDFDTELTPDDLKAWERRNGPIPAGAVVAMNSGWDARIGDARKFFGHDDKNRYHMPGFHVEAVQFLHQARDVIGIASDTISLDPGLTKTFPVHHYWLGQNKWGLENIANLGKLPEKGATIVVGAPRILGATGGPSRVFALVG
jgi:kynurenine formamidase